ncbi:MAG TPA: hypothetical protein VNL14_23955 [Candidatus Acidoferrales bacterium]|nr:hypothetical protein [Candidatus Acidoferrales bacterium]
MPALISAAVEGPTDEAVAVRLIHHVGAEAGVVYGKQGKPHLRERVSGYNRAARHAPWLVLVDLDRDADCAPPLRTAWLPDPAPRLCFRVAVRAIEAWLLADAETIADFLGVARSKVPALPETLDHPRTALVNLARTSRRKDIRQDMAPREGSGRPVGPAYTSRLIEYAGKHWRPTEAAKRADSLARAIRCLRWLARLSQFEQGN